MKSVMFSDIVRVPDRPRSPFAPSFARRLAAFSLAFALGLPALVMAMHLMDPTAPLAFIVVPVMVGSLLPLAGTLPARLDVTTRFHARHLLGTLDEALGKLGYTATLRTPRSLHYCARVPHWRAWRTKDITVTVHDHIIELSGPISVLRTLRRQMLR